MKSLAMHLVAISYVLTITLPLALSQLGLNNNRLVSSQQTVDQNKKEQELLNEQHINSLCKNRGSTEYFRLSTDGDCRDVVRCDQAGFSGKIRLASVRCPSGLAFDLEKQTCNWAARVANCDQLSIPRAAKPIFNTPEPVCPDEQLQCGDGECLPSILFCDEKRDCKDGSDENSCAVGEDPNAAPLCDLSQCLLPECFCSADGTVSPGNFEINQVPQMITLTFNGAVTTDNIDLYQDLFTDTRINPNGCTIKGTFFVSHKYTNYSAVQELHRKGHEVGVFSITNKDDAKYWSKGTYDDWLAEMAGSRLIIERFANLTDGSVLGVRAPYLRVGGNKQFEMMVDQFFAYDASITASLGRVPIWPYTLHHRMPHSCSGNAQSCPTRSHAVWEMVINELDRRDDPEFDESLTGCHLVSSCSNIYTKEQFKRLLTHNFNRHYQTNRAPLSLSFDASWIKSNKGFDKVLQEFVDTTLAEHSDVYFVTELQVLQWLQNPTELNQLRDFVEWKDKCQIQGQPFCSLPNACPLTTREIPGEVLRLHTCIQCPKNYPWILDPTGDGFNF